MSDRDATFDVSWNPARDPAWTRGPASRTRRARCTTRSRATPPPRCTARRRWRPSSGWAPSCSRTRARASACPRSRPSARGGRRPGPWPTAWARRPSPPNLRRCATALRGAPMTLVCATEGNHGRAVARAASWLGLEARVVVPAPPRRARVQAIEAEGARVEHVDGDYDAAVRQAANLADDRTSSSPTPPGPATRTSPAASSRATRRSSPNSTRSSKAGRSTWSSCPSASARWPPRPLATSARRRASARAWWDSSPSTPPVSWPRPGPGTRSRSAGT